MPGARHADAADVSKHASLDMLTAIGTLVGRGALSEGLRRCAVQALGQAKRQAHHRAHVVLDFQLALQVILD